MSEESRNTTSVPAKETTDADKVERMNVEDEITQPAEKQEEATPAAETGEKMETTTQPAEKQEEATPAAETGEKMETKKADPKLLDLAFCMDCTGSMGSYISAAQQNIRTIVEQVVAAEQADIHLALIEYRDHPPQDSTFITRVLDFTSSVSTMKSRLDQCSAAGGGDAAEAVADAMHDLLKLSWRDNSVKICVFISDAPPHGLGAGSDGFPNGCPFDLDPMVIANQLAAKGVTIYLVGCEPSILPYKDWFQGIAHLTGGQYVPLTSARLLAKVIIGGAQEELSLQQLMEELNNEIRQEMLAAADDSVAIGDLETRMYSKLKTKGIKSKQLHYGKASLPAATKEARHLSNLSNMSEVRKNFAPKTDIQPTHSAMTHERYDLMKRPSAMSSSGSRKSGSPGLMSRMWNALPSFGSSGKPEAAPAPSYLPDPPSAFAAESTSVHAADDSYETIEDDIAYEQVSRMVQKSLATNNLKSKCKKDSD